jgi:hypothetical protein
VEAGEGSASGVEYQLAGQKEWASFKDGYTLAGDSNYVMVTLAGKKGDRVELPRKPFKTTVWFDFKKAFGHSPGHSENSEIREVNFIFPHGDSETRRVYFFTKEKKDFLPMEIKGDTAVIRMDTGTIKDEDENWNDDSLDALEEGGTEKALPLSSFFDRDGHLKIRESDQNP